jgi:8-oxo-dGTP pyrophosphatase MutT (NUDIX family)
MYKVFINDKPLFFIKEDKENKTGLTYFKSIDSILEVIQKLESDATCTEAFLYHPDINIVKKAFFNMHQFIEAAGGLILNDQNQILFIFRLEKWDLPKGKIETGETPSEAAFREVQEECGISELQMVKELPATFHTYQHHGKRVLKKTYWYELFCNDPENIKAQAEENITGIEWVPSKDIELQLSNTYGSIADVLNSYFFPDKTNLPMDS